MIGELAVPHSVLRQIVRAGVEHAEIFLPDRTAVHVERVQPLRSEERDDVAAVGERRRVGVGRLDVPLLFWLAGVSSTLPDGFAAGAIVGHHDPLLGGAIFRRGAVAVETGLEGHVLATADRTRHEDPIARNDRARVREAGDRDLPSDVRAGRDAPRIRQMLTVSDAGRGRTAEPRPGGVRRRLDAGRSPVSRDREKKRTHHASSCHAWPICRRW